VFVIYFSNGRLRASIVTANSVFLDTTVAILAQSVERRHGKAEVSSSILEDGSRKYPPCGVFLVCQLRECLVALSTGFHHKGISVFIYSLMVITNLVKGGTL
jgi:hypothetical protein